SSSDPFLLRLAGLFGVHAQAPGKRISSVATEWRAARAAAYMATSLELGSFVGTPKKLQIVQVASSRKLAHNASVILHENESF
ncbi:hypothetical protein, partial [Sinorhizobium fredii]|uniref:hypothetical protein n=1 Tax=Rhizobium fredii TaxID=380 RepID=UPI001AEBEDD7